MKKIFNTKSSFFLFFLFFYVFQHTFSNDFDSLENEVNRLSHYMKTKAFELLDSMYLLAYNSPDSSLLIARCIYEESILKQRQGIIDTILTERIKKRSTDVSNTLHIKALLQSALGANLISQGKYAEAFPILLIELETFKQLENNRNIIRNLNYLGNICYFIHLNSLANYYFTEAFNYTTPDLHEYYYTKSNSFIFLARDNVDTAIDSMLYLIKTAENKNHKEILPLLYLNIGAYMLDSSLDMALLYLTKMKELDFENPYLEAILYGNLATYYYNKKDFHEALRNFKHSQRGMEENNDFINLTYLYSEIASTFEMLNMLDSALFYAKKNQELYKKLGSNTIAVETHQKYITTILEISQKDLIIAEQIYKLKSRRFAIVLIVSFAVILIISLFLKLLYHQKKLKESENRELLTKIQHKEIIQKLEKEKQQEIIDSKTREITSYSLLVSNKNALLKNILELNAQIIDNYGSKIEPSAKINEIIKNNINIDEEWDNFKMHFDKVHPNFFEKIREQCKDLSEDNLKMCAYIKMGMSNKQIAQLLHVEYNSVIVSKQRIKKKMNLDDDMNLSEFIGEILVNS